MPTGYTCKVQTGELTDHKEFLWNIAHMFGGFIGVGSDFNIDSDAEKHMEMSTYYDKTIKGLQIELEEYRMMTDEELQVKLDKKYEETIRENEFIRERYVKERQRYTDMLTKVCNWNPPTTEHENIKKEAIKQLNSSIESDCCEDYIAEPTRYDAKEYRQEMIVCITERLARAYDEHSRQIKAHRNKVEWMKALQESLK